MTKNNYTVLHAPTSVGGNPQGLSRALNLLGVGSENWIYRQNKFAYQADKVLWQERYGFLRRELVRLVSIFVAVFSYDVVHYNFGTTLAGARPPPPRPSKNLFVRTISVAGEWYLRALCSIELKLLRFLNKPIFVHFQGDDIRQGDFLRTTFSSSVAEKAEEYHYYHASDKFKRQMVRKFGLICDEIYALNPDLLRVLPARAKFQPYGHIFLDEWLPVYSQLDTGRPLRICHAPSNRAVKGTDLIIRAIETMRAEGFKLDFMLVEGMSQREAKKCYESADVFVDQLFCGWYGGLAVEAMALGKPVVVYLREEDLVYIPEQMRNELPFIRATSESINDVLRCVLSMSREALFEIAKRSRAFVERWHDPVKIASEIKNDYEEALRRRKRV